MYALCLAVSVATTLADPRVAAAQTRPAAAVVPVSTEVVSATPEELASEGEFPPEAIEVGPASGGWFAFSQRDENQLLRISEGGQPATVTLPPKFRNASDIEFVPLERGWDLLIARLAPGKVSYERNRCSEEWPEPTGFKCGELIVSQRTPAGAWTPLQTLPDLGTKEEQVAKPVEVAGKIELVWWEESDGPFRISVARPGGRFTRPRKIQPLPETHVVGIEDATTITLNGRLYVRGQYVVEPHKRAHFDVLRAVQPNGHLGPAVLINHPQRIEIIWGIEIGEGFVGANGSETLLVELPSSEGQLRTFGVIRRAAGSGRYSRPRLLARHIAFPLLGVDSYAQSQNHRLLVLPEQEINHQTVLSGVEVSPQGKVGPVRYIETIPPRPEFEAPDYGWDGAINDAGSALVATTSSVPGESIWLHPAGSACPSFGSKVALGQGELLGIFSGRTGLFHILWVNPTKELEITTARVACN